MYSFRIPDVRRRIEEENAQHPVAALAPIPRASITMAATVTPGVTVG